MQPYYLDIAFLLLTFLFVVTGWRRGFVRMTGGLVSLVVSIVAGIWGVGFLEDMFGIPLSSSFVGLLFAFLTIAILVSALMHLVVSLLDLLRRLVTMIPGLGFIHRLAGAVVGFLESGVLLLSVSYLAVYVLATSNIRTLLLSSQSIAYGARFLAMLGF
jgi:membrane protein required for colicin V production